MGTRGIEVGENQIANLALMILITVQSHSFIFQGDIITILVPSIPGEHVSCQSYGWSIYGKERFISHGVSRQKWLKSFTRQLLRSWLRTHPDFPHFLFLTLYESRTRLSHFLIAYSRFTHNPLFSACIHTALNRWLLYIDTGSVKVMVSFYFHSTILKSLTWM